MQRNLLLKTRQSPLRMLDPKKEERVKNFHRQACAQHCIERPNTYSFTKTTNNDYANDRKDETDSNKCEQNKLPSLKQTKGNNFLPGTRNSIGCSIFGTAPLTNSQDPDYF